VWALEWSWVGQVVVHLDLGSYLLESSGGTLVAVISRHSVIPIDVRNEQLKDI
jgi:hypothetical protein